MGRRDSCTEDPAIYFEVHGNLFIVSHLGSKMRAMQGLAAL